MIYENFLDSLAKQIIEKFEYNFSNLEIVLPNKRAIIFFNEELKKISSQTFFAPKIKDIQTFTQEVSQLRLIDNINLLFEFYTAYQEVNGLTNNQTFTDFSKWAKIALSDFNEIDNYLLDIDSIINYLKDIDRIKNWEVKPDISSKPKEYILFWESLPKYYFKLRENLQKKKLGYSGMINRYSTEKMEEFVANNSNTIFIFAGFNALNKCEENLIKFLLKENKAFIYWDSDTTFMNDFQHHSSFHLRNIKKNWSYFKTNPFLWINDNYSKEKNIQIINTSENISQTKIVGNIIQNVLEIEPNLSNTAVVLGNEELLLPLLNELPQVKDSLNITMGYKSSLTGINHLFNNIFKLHISALKRNKKNPIFYYKEVEAVLSDPILFLLINNSIYLNQIRQNNYTYFNFSTLSSFYNSENEIINLVFKVNEHFTAKDFMDLLILLIKKFKNLLEVKEEKDVITITFLHSIYDSMLQLNNYYSNNSNKFESIEELYVLYNEIINLSEVSFEGKPLQGLQIMGMLETRLLDFENLIITNVNEGFIPVGKTNNSFIPQDLKREFNLPTFKEKDALISYYFFRLLSRAKNIYLIYNDNTTGINNNEKSRFLSQIEINPQKNHKITQLQYYAPIFLKNNDFFEVKKDENVIEILKRHIISGFSPSSLTTYIRDQETFYKQYVLQIKQFDEVEENIANNTFGTIIHNILENLFLPYINIELNTNILQNIFLNVSKEIQEVFKKIYKKGELNKGKNLVTISVVQQFIEKYLELEKKALERDSVTILALEKSYDCIIEDEKLPFPIQLKGKIDRIEIRNSKIRIIDYKTGKVELSQVKVSGFKDLTTDIKNEKKIQLLCYLLMTNNKEEFKDYELQAGIIAFKNLNSGFLPLCKIINKQTITHFTSDDLEEFKQELIQLILEILNPSIPFSNTNK